MKTSLTGSLSFLGFVDLLQLLGSNGSSGVLRIESKYATEPGVVYFSNGNPVDATNGARKGLEALYALFGWSEGEFVFSKDNIERKKVIKNTRMEVILDGLKKLDDGQIEKLGPDTLVKSVSDPASDSTIPLIKGPLIDYSYVVDEEEYYDGAKIVEEGRHGNWIWVILEGVVDVMKESSQGPVPIVKIGQGAFIGGMGSFLLEGHMRSASAVANGKVQLGVIDAQRISNEYARMSTHMKGIMRTLENRLHQVTERVVEIRQGHNRLEAFVKDRKPVIKQGAKDQKLFVITGGHASSVRTAEKKQYPLVTMGVDDYFGFMPFADMGHEPFSASVYGTEDLTLQEVDLKKLQSEYDSMSSSIKRILEGIAINISVTTMLISEPGQHPKNNKP